MLQILCSQCDRLYALKVVFCERKRTPAKALPLKATNLGMHENRRASHTGHTSDKFILTYEAGEKIAKTQCNEWLLSTLDLRHFASYAWFVLVSITTWQWWKNWQLPSEIRLVWARTTTGEINCKFNVRGTSFILQISFVISNFKTNPKRKRDLI